MALETKTEPLATPITREKLQALLGRASELEHVLMCTYLFTAYTLKQDASEGGFSEDPALRGPQLAAVASWKGKITGVAIQEMLHLALASNLLSAIGGVPQFSRKTLNFPISSTTMAETFGYGGRAWLGLWPFSEITIKRFVWYEAYEHEEFPGPLWDGKFPLVKLRDPNAPLRGLEGTEVSNLVELYEAIACGLISLNTQLGPDELFKPEYRSRQVTDQEVTGLFNFPPATIVVDGQVKNRPLLNRVTDLHSALTAINTIIVQGEGDVDEWQEFVNQLDIPADCKVFPTIHTPSHHDTFSSILLGTPATQKQPATPGYYQLRLEDSDFDPVRNVPQDPLAKDPCGEDKNCRLHVHLITDPFTRDVAILFDDLYAAMLNMLWLGFTLDSTSNDDAVESYEKATLVQAAIRSMVYIIAPLGNLLTQLPGDEKGTWFAGPGFTWQDKKVGWEELEKELNELTFRAATLGKRAPTTQTWVTPSYLGIPPSGHSYPQESVQTILCERLAPDLYFMADRMKRVRGHAPKPEFEKHVCQGLNACAGQDIEGRARMAGEGSCATADPHVCSGQNHCRGQGGCGFSPSGSWALQNRPGENNYAGQVKDADGFYQFNPQADSACGSPILPSLLNTYGLNTPPSDGRGGREELYKKAHGYVWDHARLLFEERMRSQGIHYSSASGIDRYRDLCGKLQGGDEGASE